jgi:hypothetical protein
MRACGFLLRSKEAFNMLANELLGFIRRQYTGSMDVSADSAGDDVYTWSVEMWKSAFKPDCQLAKVRLSTHSIRRVECFLEILRWKLLPEQCCSKLQVSVKWAVPYIHSAAQHLQSRLPHVAFNLSCSYSSCLSFACKLLLPAGPAAGVSQVGCLIHSAPLHLQLKFSTWCSLHHLLLMLFSPVLACTPSTLQDLQEVSAKWAVSSIQLRFTFTQSSPHDVAITTCCHYFLPCPGSLSLSLCVLQDLQEVSAKWAVSSIQLLCTFHQACHSSPCSPFLFYTLLACSWARNLILQDLQEVSAKWAVSSIQLRFTSSQSCHTI